MEFHNQSLCPACWRCYRKPLWSWKEQQRWWEGERPVCRKCMLPDVYTRSSIRIRKINLGGLSELGGALSWFPAVQSKYFHTLGICQRGVWGNGFPETLCPEVPMNSSRGMWRCWGNLWTIWGQSQEGSEDMDLATRGKWPKLQVGPRMIVQTLRDLPSHLETPETDQSWPYCCTFQKSPEGGSRRNPQVGLRVPSPTPLRMHTHSSDPG